MLLKILRDAKAKEEYTVCRGCIIKYFDNCRTACPNCNIIYKKKNQVCFRSDPVIQSLVYKLVPNLYSREKQTREDFYRSTGVRASSSCSDDSVIDKERDNLKDEEDMVSSNAGDKPPFFSSDDMISLSMEYYQTHLDDTPINSEKDTVKNTILNIEPSALSDNKSDEKSSDKDNTSVNSEKNELVTTKQNGDSVGLSDNKESDAKDGDCGEMNEVEGKRYLKCPAAVNMLLLQKFVRMKYGLTLNHRVRIPPLPVMDALHPKRELPQPEQKSPAIADEQKQSTPVSECPQKTSSSDDETKQPHQKVKLVDVNSSLTCELCKGYLIDATTISECLHSFCRSCIIKFLEDNSFCPVCEVIINKAKPNLKLDKTLQDIVYKLVPGLFLSEMMRRRNFHADMPAEAAKLSPEQRGEDTERTIFNPQDRISLSLEYIGDAATTGLILKDLKQREGEEVQAESLLKRYLQCPAMCRIEVIKKFIRNKYNVNTDMFQIDILYKRVPLPLPDHYTLIDVAYIYTWKRNEPMRFYFRIIDKGNDELPDLTKVFTPLEEAALMPRPTALSTPLRSTKGPAAKEKTRRTSKRCAKKTPVVKPAKKEKKDDDDSICDKKRCASDSEASPVKSDVGKLPKTENARDVSDLRTREPAVKKEPVETSEASSVRVKKETGVSEERCDNGKVYTNITLNRSNNVEIVTKIQKLSDNDGRQIEVNVIDQSGRNNTVAPSSSSEGSEPKVEVKTETVKEEPDSVSPANVEPSSSRETEAKPKQEPKQQSPSPEVSSTTDDLPVDAELEKTKFEFLKSIELTSKRVMEDLAKLVERQKTKAAVAGSSKPTTPKTETPVAKKPAKPSGGVKRKNPSPIKTEAKRPNVEQKRTTKIILQQKPGYPPLNLAKPSEKPGENNRKELRSLFQNCRLNIPASLSITLRENGETSRQPVQMPPVQNFIEILKIDEKAGTQTVTLKREETATKPEASATNGTVAKPSTPPQTTSTSQKETRKESTEKLTKKQREQQSFQKIFEASIKKTGPDQKCPNPTEIAPNPGKSKILEIAQQLYKKTKTELETKQPSTTLTAPCASTSSTPKLQKVAIPRLSHKASKPASKKGQKMESPTHQTLTNLHSSSLGLNYTVSVDKQPREVMNLACSKVMASPRSGNNQIKASPGGGLDHAMSTPSSSAGFLTQPSLISPRTLEVKSEKDSLKIPTVHSPRPSIASPAPKTEPGCLPPPQSFSPRTFSPKQRSKQPSPRPKSGIPSPVPRTSTSPSSSGSSALTANEILEKYNIQNLAQLSASMNFNAQAYLNSMSNKQMTALHQTMLMKQMELQNRQNWFNINQAPLLQYEKYLQTLNASKNHLMGNLKDN